MAHRRKKQKHASAKPDQGYRAGNNVSLQRDYRDVCRVAAEGHYDHASRLYSVLRGRVSEPRLKALIVNDLAALDAAKGNADAARRGFEEALLIDHQCEPAHANLAALVAPICASSSVLNRQTAQPLAEPDTRSATPATLDSSAVSLPLFASVVSSRRSVMPSPPAEPPNGVKVAILSMLFNCAAFTK
jgi:hypothetical protein